MLLTTMITNNTILTSRKRRHPLGGAAKDNTPYCHGVTVDNNAAHCRGGAADNNAAYQQSGVADDNNAPIAKVAWWKPMPCIPMAMRLKMLPPIAMAVRLH
jgi:hypothetical protein